MPGPHDEDTTELDREMIAGDLERVAKLAGRLGFTELATKIGALAGEARAALKSANAQGRRHED